MQHPIEPKIGNLANPFLPFCCSDRPLVQASSFLRLLPIRSARYAYCSVRLTFRGRGDKMKKAIVSLVITVLLKRGSATYRRPPSLNALQVLAL